MAIVDQYGKPYRYPWKFAHAADQNTARGPGFNNVLDDIAELIPQHDRRTLQALSRRLYTNFGVLKSAVDQKANYSIGPSWQPVFASPDLEAAAQAKAWVMGRFYPVCEMRGPSFDWRQCLTLVSQALDRDGEAFILLTESKQGLPRIQLIPSHRIGQQNGGERKVEKGPYKGLAIKDGVITNKYGRAVGYRVLLDGGKEIDVSARDLVHVYNPDYQEQLRGLPAFTHALTDFLHCMKSTSDERTAQAMVSSLGLIEYNESGEADFDDPAFALTEGADKASGITTQLYAGGTTRYFKANSGAKLESVQHTRPGDMWERFHDRLIRAALAGVQWPMALIWKAAGQGTAERSEVMRARRAIEERQAILTVVARRVVSYAVAKAINLEILPPFERFWDVGFTLPPRLTVDDGREINGYLAAYDKGALNMTELCAHKGKTVADHYRERAVEVAERKRIAREVSQETGEAITESDMGAEESAAPAPVPSTTTETVSSTDAAGTATAFFDDGSERTYTY